MPRIASAASLSVREPPAAASSACTAAAAAASPLLATSRAPRVISSTACEAVRTWWAWLVAPVATVSIVPAISLAARPASPAAWPERVASSLSLRAFSPTSRMMSWNCDIIRLKERPTSPISSPRPTSSRCIRSREVAIVSMSERSRATGRAKERANHQAARATSAERIAPATSRS